MIRGFKKKRGQEGLWSFGFLFPFFDGICSGRDLTGAVAHARGRRAEIGDSCALTGSTSLLPAGQRSAERSSNLERLFERRARSERVVPSASFRMAQTALAVAEPLLKGMRR